MNIPKLAEGSPVEIAARVMLDISRGEFAPSWDPLMPMSPIGSPDIMPVAERERGRSILWDVASETFYRFSDGRWRPVEFSLIERLIGRYDAMDYGTAKAQFRMNATIAKGVHYWLKTYCTDPEFFAQELGTYAVNDQTARMGIGIGVFDSQPEYACRSGIDGEILDPSPLLAAIDAVICPVAHLDLAPVYRTIFLEWLGLCLTGCATDWGRGLILLGTHGPMGGGGNNGKSELQKTISSMFSPETRLSMIGGLDMKQDYQKERLRGKRLLSIGEMDSGKLDIKRMNALVTGGEDEGRRLGQMGTVMDLICGVVWDCNRLPTLQSDGLGGVKRRWGIIPCYNDMRASSTTKADIEGMRETLLPGLAIAALQAAHEVYSRGGLTPMPQLSTDILRLWLRDANPVDIWREECLLYSDRAFVETVEAWERYREWVDSGKFRCPLTRRQWIEHVYGNLPDPRMRRGHDGATRRAGIHNAIVTSGDIGAPPEGKLLPFLKANP